MTKTQTITEFFEKDHREIDAIFDSVRFVAEASDRARFEEFARRLELHIRWEEEYLFPAAGKAAPELENGPIRVMLMEHVEIKAQLAKALAAWSAGDPSTAKKHASLAREVLGGHNHKEEMILYPMSDQLIADAGALIASLPR